MALMADIILRVRRELGDQGAPFEHAVIGDGVTLVYDIPVGLILSTGFSAKKIHGATVTALTEGTDYTLDRLNGVITLVAPIASGDTGIFSGSSTALFTDDELTQYINDAVTQHTSGRTVEERYRDAAGFIKYDEVPITLNNLPESEDFLVVLLATIEAMWALSTDASTDIDVQTAEGTMVPRSERYRQILQQIDLLTEKYERFCRQLNVGLFRIEVSELRRKSKQTNRLVPLYKSREYDDNSPPQRLLPPIDHRNDDESGIPSPSTGGWW